ncbi:2-C-methyl-D-erythritol 4-phosphate cytidylyltransferase [Pediococcus ethanolidurans]|uniref:IspD/TarI family cytidylyltransferase n=1 Tax=Pediococcus ethanolidurans TaxID=319653 RepID=UPI0021E77650|nr:IspD/TarI family cytidylyltransferase [Pediococcus ethanolidurans]MCV3324502.1 2-C-methyl-D-erythritol 4-phosphate cytidylyltransferase [Pediococcus ethanolidurans]
MNYAIIFAGGVGRRMNNGSLPKQFLEVHGKPIIIYTLEKFDRNPLIDGVVVICVAGWEDYLQEKINLFGLNKICKILTGGKTAVKSQFIGIDYVKTNLVNDSDTVVLLHDGVRPLIDQKTIDANIKTVQLNGSAITTVPAIETIGISSESGDLERFVDRSKCVMARAPQSYHLDDVYTVHLKAQLEQKSDLFVDSATMMQYYGFALHTVEGNTENIKVTTQTDFYLFRAILDAREEQQMFGGNQSE